MQLKKSLKYFYDFFKDYNNKNLSYVSIWVLIPNLIPIVLNINFVLIMYNWCDQEILWNKCNATLTLSSGIGDKFLNFFDIH